MSRISTSVLPPPRELSLPLLHTSPSIEAKKHLHSKKNNLSLSDSSLPSLYKPPTSIKTLSPPGSTLKPIGRLFGTETHEQLSAVLGTSQLLKLSPHDEVKSYDKKHTTCIEILSKGYVHSFVDFFYITHPEIQALDEDDISLKVPDDSMQMLKDNLISAEASLPANDFKAAIKANNATANYLKSLDKYPFAAHFYLKCRDIAKRANDMEEASNAICNLGQIYETLGEYEKATQYYEEYLETTTKAEDKKGQNTACFHLIRMYTLSADNYEQKYEWNKSIPFLEKSLQKALFSENVKAEATANYRLGLAYKAIGEQDKHITHLERYLELCRSLNDLEGLGIASIALANAYQSTNDISKSKKFLEENFSLAESTNQQIVKAEASGFLGLIYTKEGNYEKAVSNFETYFSTARAVNDQKMLDRGRVYLGIARGNLNLDMIFNKKESASKTLAALDQLVNK